jgi:hypothetical protein
MKTQSSFIRQREEENFDEKELYQLTKADFNLLKLVDATTTAIQEKTKNLDQLSRIVKFETRAVQNFALNYKKYKERASFDQDRQILSFKSSLKKTQDLIDQNEEEEVQRVKRVLQNTEKIKDTFARVHMLVMQQAQVIDRIDYNLSQGVVFLNKANKELLILFESYNKNAFACQVFLLIVIVILSMFNFWKISRK